MIEPKTNQEWQEAVDAAAFCLALNDCKLYGLVTGPDINVARCLQILEAGRERGFQPCPFEELLRDRL